MSRDDSKLILYSFRRCPYAMRARMALSYAQLSYELREVDLRDKPDALLLASPKGTVPVLVINDEQILDESLDIVVWASQYTNKPFSGHINDHEWVAKLHASFLPCLHGYKYPERFPDLDQKENIREINLFLADLNDYINSHHEQDVVINPWIEMAVFPLVRQLWIIDDGWQHQSFSSLETWVRGIQSSSLFEQIMQKHIKWDQALNNGVFIDYGAKHLESL